MQPSRERPPQIRLFECLAYGGLAIGWLGAIINVDENFGYGGGFVILGFYMSVLAIALVFGVARGQSAACRTLLTLASGIVLPAMLLMASWLSIFSFISVGALLAALVQLWRPKSSSWLRRGSKSAS